MICGVRERLEQGHERTAREDVDQAEHEKHRERTRTSDVGTCPVRLRAGSRILRVRVQNREAACQP